MAAEWNSFHIGGNKDRLTSEVRQDLTASSDSDAQRVGNRVASAIETLVASFGDINGFSLEIKTEGAVEVGGRGHLSVAIRTIDPGVIVQ